MVEPVQQQVQDSVIPQIAQSVDGGLLDFRIAIEEPLDQGRRCQKIPLPADGECCMKPALRICAADLLQ